MRKVGLIIILGFVSVLLFGQEDSKRILILKDGSIVKGELIEEDEYKVRILSINQDTLTYSYKYIRESIKGSRVPNAYLNDNQTFPRYHNTEGTFVNLDIYAIPISIEIGKRISPSFNFGGQLSYTYNNDFGGEGVVGLAAYGRYYLSNNQFAKKGYIEGFAGFAYNQDANIDNSIKPYLGVALGLQLASRKKVRFYFELGVYTIYNTSNRLIRGNDGRFIEVRERDFFFAPQFTFLGIEF